jgi:uncharacterized protein
VKIHVHNIEEVSKDLVYDEPTASLGSELRHGNVIDFEFPEGSPVQVSYHRAGLDLFFYGHISSHPTGQCARCLEQYEFPLDVDFAVVLAPKPPAGQAPEESEEDVDIGYYEGEEIDLSPIVREQIILALPTRPLCREECRGLCPQCGANRNDTACECAEDVGDLRLSVLRTLKVSR